MEVDVEDPARSLMAADALPVLDQWPTQISPHDGPVCVRGLTAGWPIHELVRKDALSARYGDQPVTVESGSGTVEMTVGDYFGLLRSSRAAGTYMKGWTVSANLEDFAELPLPSAFDSWLDYLPEASRPDWKWIFVGPAGSASGMHVDVMCSSAWNLLVSGKKEWTFMSPARAASNGYLAASLVNVAKTDLDVEFHHLQEPGDVIIVPGGWAHAVENVQDTVSLTGNWVSESNIDIVETDLRLRGRTGWHNAVTALRSRLQGADS